MANPNSVGFTWNSSIIILPITISINNYRIDRSCWTSYWRYRWSQANEIVTCCLADYDDDPQDCWLCLSDYENVTSFFRVVCPTSWIIPCEVYLLFECFAQDGIRDLLPCWRSPPWNILCTRSCDTQSLNLLCAATGAPRIRRPSWTYRDAYRFYSTRLVQCYIFVSDEFLLAAVLMLGGLTAGRLTTGVLIFGVGSGAWT